MIIRMLACALALASVTGCATVIRGTQQDYTIESSPPGADVTLSTGQTCVTPCVLRLPRKTAFDVTFEMEGYETGTARVNSGWSREGTQTFIVGNLILGGLIGMGVDASNGATRDLWPNPLQVTMIPWPEAVVASADTTTTTEAPAQATP